ncbi:uncharacterized protein LODBEIA_P57480 [Lodderomyces beijingensis]|uniref:Glucosidase II subunit alpha n=1 Tax=Lodderomyces beijingensis TaxID=1775926 RepID=A0ABP0ZRK0_9ASCO
MHSLSRILILLTALLSCCLGVKDHLFKSCHQAGFCHRNRHYAKQVSLDPAFQSPYQVLKDSIKVEDGVLSGEIEKTLASAAPAVFPFEISIVENSFRFKMDERRPMSEGLVNPNRYNEASNWAFKDSPSPQQFRLKRSDNEITVIYPRHEVAIQLNPVTFTFFYDGKEQIVVNGKQLLNIEHSRSKENNQENLFPQESDFDMFSDSFADSKGDRLPLGPEAVALDFTLVGFESLYGIPEHADSMLLKDTKMHEPYRLYNVDIFEYEVDSRLPMYGSIPLVMAVNGNVAAGIFWINSADTYIDIEEDTRASSVHWMSENGILDFVVIIEDSPRDVNQVYGKLTGNTQLPLLSSLGYHQCRWNYNDIKDVLEVNSKFDEYEIPYDTIWLDIEYADNKKYFTWHPENFAEPGEMLQELNRSSRNLVVIIDPHIKTGYEVSNELVTRGIAMKNADNQVYYGHCWPGESVWVDTMHPESRSFWDESHRKFMISDRYKNLHLWNDMNEPSVFSGPETSAPKDNIHYGQWEHRSIHNVFGLTYHEATFQSLLARLPTQRPFILTRSYFAGSQRTAAMWTGDNMSKWEYLKISIPMVLTSNIMGMPFAGADVGGFFGNPSPELLTRWYQAGIWYPFFRAHAHIDSRRREPWMVEEPYLSSIRNAIRLRYALLPAFYTSFYHASRNGSPVIKPLFYDYQGSKDKVTFEVDDEFFLGDTGILVKPVTDAGAKEVEFFLPRDHEDIYYHFANGVIGERLNSHRFSVELNDVPMLLKGGSVVPMKSRYRRSTKLMKHDPYTLVVALDKQGKAQGSLYVDDGETIGGEFTYIRYKVDERKGISVEKEGNYTLAVNVERIVIVGIKNKVGSVSTGKLVDEGRGRITIVKPHEFPIVFNNNARAGHDEL